ncbi:flagellar basal-body MS-ring/collar protein FliF [Roseovarius sp.]
MQQIGTVWNALDSRRRVIVILASLGMFAAVLMLARLASAPSLELLYSGLESSAAGEVVTALEQRGVAYEVRGGAIFVDTAQRDTLRMTLATEGLPATSTKGYELLDGLSGFGTTSQMFDAAYWRAKEGELARTITSHPAIGSARVHIATTGSNPFQRNVQPTASVMINAAAGTVTGKHARGLQFLVASAVAGLAPEDVSIIDGAGNLIGAADDPPANATNDRSEAMRQRVERLLEARVGRGNAVVEVSVDTVTQSESLRERRVDPQSRVAISTDTEERSDTATDQGGGDVTVASNLPDGDAAGGDTSNSQSSETRERINYEVSETEREVIIQPGAVKRLTVAVLVNGSMVAAADGTETYQPRSDEEIAALRDLVASAVGFDENRGDVITIRTLEFQPVLAQGTVAEPSILDRMALDVMSLLQAAVLGIVALILGLFVIRPILAKPAAAPAAILPSPVAQRPENVPPGEALTGEIDEGDFDAGRLSLISGDTGQNSARNTDLPALSGGGEDPVARLRAMIGERQEETVEILRNWLEGEEEKAR